MRCLCDEMEKVLHGAEQISLTDFDEGALSTLTAQIRKMTVQLREHNIQLKKEHAFLKESLEDISHQLRTPLTSMLLLIDMMRDPSKKAQQRSYLQELSNLTTHMQWLIETLLNLSRLDAGAAQFHPEDILFEKVLADALEPLSVALELKDIAVHVQIQGTPQLRADQHYITEAFINLLKNCMEHTPEGGSITVEAAENPVCTQVLIKDNGNGISEEDLPHIFERFYRNSEFAKKGYGIGLAFAQKILASQNGSIRVQNAVPHGAQFDIRFYKTVI